MRKLTFWTYSEKEIDDLIEPISKLFNSNDFIRDYENVWEWIVGTSSEFKSKINISREHDWEKGKYTKPLIFTFDYKGFNKSKTVNTIGNILAKEFNAEVNYGELLISSKRDYEQKTKLTFRPDN
ncbi:hypothetical protein [Maribacter sp. 2-571]|uniref:hypothetical protein n=1 Tax=Maribacter sp. 2-571 TaxID=3417569 RepID=UPI003D334DD4